MKLPRDLSGEKLSVMLKKEGYFIIRQKGSHLRLSTSKNGEHHITIPNHTNLRVGTLSNILTSVSEHLGVSKEKLWDRLKF